MKLAKPPKAGLRDFHKIILFLQKLTEAPATTAELEEATGWSNSTLRKWLEAMRRAKLVHIAAWTKAKNGVPIPTYAWGDKADAKKPPKYTDAERQAHYRKRQALKKQLRVQNALAARPHTREAYNLVMEQT